MESRVMMNTGSGEGNLRRQGEFWGSEGGETSQVLRCSSLFLDLMSGYEDLCFTIFLKPWINFMNVKNDLKKIKEEKCRRQLWTQDVLAKQLIYGWVSGRAERLLLEARGPTLQTPWSRWLAE